MRSLVTASLAVLAFVLSGSMLVTFAPGAENTAVPSSSLRVVRALAGGTLQRTYADGRKEKVVYKTGQVKINEASPAFTTKNIGKSQIKLYVVQVK